MGNARKQHAVKDLANHHQRVSWFFNQQEEVNMSQSISGALSAEDIAAIKKVNEVFGGLIVAQDFESLVQFYTSDVVIMPPNGPTVHGHDGLRSWFEAFPRVTSMEVGVDHIEGQGDMAYVRGRYSMTIEPEGAPGPIEDRGKFIEIRKRQPDGTWPLAADIFNSDLGHE
jgi:ketosteroid isomerase-like protein